MRDHRLKNFTRAGGCFVERSLADGSDLNQMLFRIEKDDSERFTIEKPHLGTEVCDCQRTIDG